MQQQLRARQFGGIQALLQEEAAKPANAYRINGSGTLYEGVELQLGHPATGGQEALFLGEYYLLRNNQSKRGCLYQPKNGIGIARRLTVETKELDNGRKPLKLLSQYDSSDKNLYLVVEPVMELADGVKLNVKFWTGVKHSGTIVAKDNFGYGILLSFSQNGQCGDIFYEDGRVVRILRKEDALSAESLTLEEQADLRITHAAETIEAAQELEDILKVRKTDAAYHHLAEVLAIGGKRSEAVFERVYNLFVNAGKEGKLRPSVKEHVLTVLRKLSPASALQFNLDCESHLVKQQNGGAFGTLVEQPIHKPKGPSAEAKARKAARSQRDAELRKNSRGSNAEVPLHPKGGNKKK